MAEEARGTNGEREMRGWLMKRVALLLLLLVLVVIPLTAVADPGSPSAGQAAGQGAVSVPAPQSPLGGQNFVVCWNHCFGVIWDHGLHIFW